MRSNAADQSLHTRQKRSSRLLWERAAVCTPPPNWQNLLLFHNTFMAASGRGLGASHQTGWDQHGCQSAGESSGRCRGETPLTLVD